MPDLSEGCTQVRDFCKEYIVLFVALGLVAVALVANYVPKATDLQRSCIDRLGETASGSYQEFHMSGEVLAIGRRYNMREVYPGDEKVMNFQGDLFDNFNGGVTCVSSEYPHCTSNVEFYADYTDIAQWAGYPSLNLNFTNKEETENYHGDINFGYFSRDLLFAMNVTDPSTGDTETIEFEIESDIFRFVFQWWRRDFVVKHVGGEEDGQVLAVGFKNLLSWVSEMRYCIDPEMPVSSSRLFKLMPYLTIAFDMAITK